MNKEGRVLQDSQGKPKRVVLGEDGKTIFGNMLQSIFTLYSNTRYTALICIRICALIVQDKS